MKSVIELSRKKFARVVPDFIAFGGGLDIVTPPLFLPSGMCRAAQNYEVDPNGGYARITGYERFDGRPKPSDANYAIINITLTGAIAVGNTVTGVTSAATGVVIATASGYIAVTKVTGTFVSGETLNVGGVGQATTTSAAITDGASTPILHAQYKNLAADQYRADIAAIPGSGNVLGVVRFAGVTYGFRNNAGGTAAVLYQSSTGGWTAVTMYNEVGFTIGAVTTPADGETLTQGGVTATVKRVVTQSGAWAGTAAGRFIITNPAGGNFAAGAATLSGGATVTLSGVQTAITLLPNGRYEFVKENFGGNVNTIRLYGCDGVNRGFEFDGTVFVPIVTGMTTDAPSQVTAHEKQLFFSFVGSVQHSAPGTPYIWSPVLGASEIAMGDTVTGFMPQPGSASVGALAIFTRNRTAILYGTGVANWQLITYRKELGAYAYSIQDVGYTMFLDDQGVTNIQTAQAFGNFSHSALSKRVRPWLNTQRTKTTASCVSRDKSQYRLFFSDQYALYVTFDGRKIAGMMPMLLGHAVRCIWSSEESDGTETIFFGSTNGMVYQMEKGTSFDGDAIEHYLHLAFNFSKSPRVNKRYRECALEVSGSGYADFSFSYELGYASLEIPQPTSRTVLTSFSSVFWDAFTWDAFFWDGTALLPAKGDMEGTAVNVSVMLRGSSDFQQSIRFSGANVHFTPRRLLH